MNEQRIMSKYEIKAWFDRYFNIPALNRPYTLPAISLNTGASTDCLLSVFKYKRRNLTHKRQRQISRWLSLQPMPEPVEKKPIKQFKNPIRFLSIDPELVKPLAQAVGALTWTEAKELNIWWKTYRTCRMGGIPKFQLVTIKRLSKLLLAEEIVIPEQMDPR